MKSLRTLLLGSLVSAVSVAAALLVCAQDPREYKSGIIWPEPPVVTPGKDNGPPSDAVVLFNGTDLSKWAGGDRWVIKDGYAISAKGDITTKDSFGNCQLHLEFATPAEVKGRGQGRGNSGVYLMNRYEVQILDSYENTTYFDGQCGSIYKQHPPLVNACRKPGEWQTFDIVFESPRFDTAGKLTRPGHVTVLHNGVVVQNHFELQGGTFYEKPAAYTAHPPKAPMRLQFHGNPVQFRNIWVRELKEIEGRKPEKK